MMITKAYISLVKTYILRFKNTQPKKKFLGIN